MFSPKVDFEGTILISVPCSLVEPVDFIFDFGVPSLYVCSHTFPSLLIFNSKTSERALTTEIPTPCKPPETL